MRQIVSGINERLPLPQILRVAATPRWQSRSAVNRYARWYTWSDEFRRLFPAWQRQVPALGRPLLIHLNQGRRYDGTFTLDPLALEDKVLREEIFRFAADLAAMAAPRHILLLTDLFCNGLDSFSLQCLLAYFRAAIVEVTGEPMAALYAPLGTTGSGAGAFPLHADLYVPEILWIIFDEVPQGRSGASLFAPASALLGLLDQVPEIPAATRALVRACFEGPAVEDQFDTLFSLLYGGRELWRRTLRRSLRVYQVQIKLHRGQGYLLHDRAWLHGRATPRGGVAAERLHRLIFGGRRAAVNQASVPLPIGVDS